MSQTKDPGQAGRQMQVSEAQKMISSYQTKCATDDIRSLKISADFIRKIIDQPGCEYVRFFVALADPNAGGSSGLMPGHSLVIVGATSKGTNILKGENDSQVYDDLDPCPTSCDDGSYNLI